MINDCYFLLIVSQNLSIDFRKLSGRCSVHSPATLFLQFASLEKLLWMGGGREWLAERQTAACGSGREKEEAKEGRESMLKQLAEGKDAEEREDENQAVTGSTPPFPFPFTPSLPPSSFFPSLYTYISPSNLRAIL